MTSWLHSIFITTSKLRKHSSFITKIKWKIFMSWLTEKSKSSKQDSKINSTMPIKNKKIKRKMIKNCKVQTTQCKQAAFRVTLLRLQCSPVILDLRLIRQVQLLLKQTFSNSSEVLKSLEMIKKLQQIQS